MNFIKSSVEIVPQEFGIKYGLQHVEKAARNCYKSEDKITDTSYEDFLQMLLDRKHYSPFEHFTIYLKLYRILNGDVYNDMLLKYSVNPYSVVNIVDGILYITTNYRVILENDWSNDLIYMCKPEEHHEKRVTVHMVCSIGVSREANRHRMSISEQSTRYCNYTKDKFGSQLNFVVPQHIYNTVNPILYNNIDEIINDVANIPEVHEWLIQLRLAEISYMDLINKWHWTPQEARGVLPLDTATSVYYTGTISQWKNFFDLRTAPGAHPDIKVLATELEHQFKENNLI